MGWTARAAACSLVTLFGCAALAGVDEPPTDPASTPSDPKIQGGSDASVAKDAAPSPPQDAAPVDGAQPVDAGPDVYPGCTKAQNGGKCDKPEDCCSGFCTEQHKCQNSCKVTTSSFGCAPAGDTCCVGSYCSAKASAACTKCIAQGSAAEKNLGVADPHSCCSGNVDIGTGNCKD